MKKKGQIDVPVVILFTLVIIVLILLIFLIYFQYQKNNYDNPKKLQNITRMEQIDDSISHNLSLTNNPPSCQDECSARGLRRCSGNGYKICGNFDSDSCYEWSSITNCGSNEECSSGRCAIVQSTENNSINNNPSEDSPSVTRYDFDEVEILSTEQFNISKTEEGPNTWADILSGNQNKLEVTTAMFNLKRDGQILKNEEEYLKVMGPGGEKRFLYNSGGGFIYLAGGLKSINKQFWSAKQLIGDDVIKDKTPPVYSVTLSSTLNEDNKFVSAKLAFSDDGLDLETRDKYFDWSTNQSASNNETNPEQNQTDSEIECLENKKSGICGPEDKIYPLSNLLEGSTINVYSPGVIFEDDNFKLSFEGSENLVQFQDYPFKIIIQNKKSAQIDFDYNYIFNSQNCPNLYDPQHSSFNNLPNSSLIKEGKSEFYRVTFNPLETKEFIINIRPNLPTITTDSISSYLMLYYLTPSMDYTIYFNGLVKSGTETIIKGNQTITREPELVSCGNSNFSNGFALSCVGETGDINYGYYNSKCCNNIFYPDFECCNNLDCSSRDNTDGYCVDGLCMPSIKSQNKLFGNKKLLIGEFTGRKDCIIKPSTDLSQENLDSVTKLESYYDQMAKVVLNETSDFVNFNVTTVLELPDDLRGFYDNSKTEQIFLDEIKNRCGIDSSNYDMLIFPTETTTFGGAAGFALGVGNSKVVFFNNGNTPTLIHEVGHIFGCIDLYQKAGGRLQWAHTLYGEKRVDNVPFDDPQIGPYNLIDGNRISELSLKNFQVCRGYLGWTDNNKNGIVDVKEW